MGLNLIDFFDKGVAIEPDRPCLVGIDETRTYRQAQRSSYRIANALIAAGVKPQTRAAVLSHNAIRPFECVLGALRAGCTWVPVNARNATEETVYVLSHTDAEVLFYSAAFSPQIAGILERCPKITLAICIDGPGVAGGPAFDDWIAGTSEARPEVWAPGDALASLACSGGTTGHPKGVMTTHQTWAFRIAETRLRAYHPRPVHLVAAPMTHGAGAGALELMSMGATHIILPGFDPAAIIDAIGRHGVTHMFLPPTALYRLMAHPDALSGNYASLRYLTCAGAPVSPERMKEALSLFGPAMHTGYGGTEFGTSTCWYTGEELLAAVRRGDEARLLSCGRPSALARVEIVDDAGVLLPAGEAGEIAIRSYSNASGYYKNPDETARSFRDGWFLTGDVGFKDEGGWLYISDRKKDMIISGGLNIYPSEIEHVLMANPAIQDCAVIGVPDDDWGEAVKAVIELKPGASTDAGELEQACRAVLAGYKVPKSFEFWPEIPRSPVGKVLKRAIRDQFWKDARRAV